MLWHFVVVKKKTWKESFGKSKRRCHSSVFNMRPHTPDSRTPLPTSSSLSYTPSHIFLVIHPPHIMGKSLGIQKEKTKKGDIYRHFTRIWKKINFSEQLIFIFLNCPSWFFWTAHLESQKASGLSGQATWRHFTINLSRWNWNCTYLQNCLW